jgi:type III secretory pathway component EscV
MSLGTVVMWCLAAAVGLYVLRTGYEVATDGDGLREALEDSAQWYGALAGAVVGVGALAIVEGVDVVAMFVEFVGGHALGFVAATLTGLAALLAEGLVTLSAGQVAGIAVALVGLAMVSGRWVDEW